MLELGSGTKFLKFKLELDEPKLGETLIRMKYMLSWHSIFVETLEFGKILILKKGVSPVASI